MTTQTESPSEAILDHSGTPWRWGAARVLIILVFAMLGAAMAGALFLDEGGPQTEAFVHFLTGQSGWAEIAAAPTSVVFWKILLGMGLGGMMGQLFSREIPEEHLKRARTFALGGLLFLISVGIYIPSMPATFIWDDDQEITANPSLGTTYGLWEIWTGGLSNPAREGKEDPAFISWVRPQLQALERSLFGENKRAHESADYFPLKTTMLWLEYKIWGLNPHGYHTVNILVHAVDALLLWLVLSQLRVPGAWLGALLFAIHPVHVESVSWIAERKNTLSLFFLLLSFSTWLRFERTRGWGGYTASVLLFLAALLCKTSVVMYPVALVLCLWWQHGLSSKEDFRKLLPRVAFTAPYFALSLALGLLTIWFQHGRAIGDEVIPIGDYASRTAGAGLALWWYLEKALLPINLTTIYPRFPINPPGVWPFVAGALYLALLGLLFAAQRRVGRTPFFVLAFFTIFLVPVLGFVPMSYMRLTLVADHFQYLSNLSIVAAAGAAIAIFHEKLFPPARTVFTAGVAVLVVVLCLYSWNRAGVHLGPQTLWPDALKHNEASWQANNHMGAVLYGEGRIAEAGKYFARAVELNPANPEVHNNMGLIHAFHGRTDDAIAEYRKAVEIKGDVPAMRRNLADALAKTGQFAQAAEHYYQILEAMPWDVEVRVAYGYALYELGQYAAARRQFEMVLRQSPGHAQARQNLEVMDAKGQ